MSRHRAERAERKRNLRDAREKEHKDMCKAHREIIFGDCPDTLVIPEGVVFECIERPSKC